MKKTIIISFVCLAVAIVAVYNFHQSNLRTAHITGLSNLTMNNVEALANNSSEVFCQTITTFVHEDIEFCPLCNKDEIRVRVSTQECNNGWLSYCYPGYISEYLDCKGEVETTLDNTYFSRCN